MGDDVRTILSRGDLPARTCPACRREERTRDERCTHCGASYFGRSPAEARRRRRRATGVAAVATLLLAVAVGAVLEAAADREARERAEIRRAVAAKRAELRRVQRPHRGAAPLLRPAADAGRAERLRARAALVAHVEGAILRDARGRARTGELDGPISEAQCGPLLRSKDAVPDDRDLSKEIGRYDCVAVTADVQGSGGRSVASLGHPFVAALDFRRFTYTWCRNTPAQGERGQALVFVRLERACLAARGRALGTGYVDVPGG